MERDVGVLRRVSVVVMLTLSFYKSERSMLSHFVGSPLTNCAAERKPLSTDGNAMKEGEREGEREREREREREIEGASLKGKVVCNSNGRRNSSGGGSGRSLCKSGKKRQCHSSGFVKFNWSRLTQSQSSKRHWPKGKEGQRERGGRAGRA